jgi:outer membrane protein insertion porin family
LKYQIEEIKIDDIEEDAPYDIKEEGEKTELQSSISLELIRNTTDSPRWPTLGYIIEFSNEVSGGFLGGDIDFIKTELDFSYFIPGFKTKLGRQVLAFHAFYGSLKNIFNSDDEPSYEKYFLGGSDTVRGYGDRDIKFFKNVTYTDGTTGLESFGGKSEMYFNIEYRIPLVKDTISSVLFFDGGNLHLDSFSFPKDTWRYGFGLGFRITTPMGNLRLDWAKRLNETYPGAGDRGETEIHFNIGNMF